MNGALVPLLGFDNQGQVFDLGHAVLRKIVEDQKDTVANLFRIYSDERLSEKGIVETSMQQNGDLLHRKLIVSYPYEWPASMYKDALLHHFQVNKVLAKIGLILKDALPNNILFENTEPTFVDFLSLTWTDKLKEQRWLDPDRYADPRFAILERMLFPYMLLPLVFMARREYPIARDLLSWRSCNCDGPPPSWKELFATNRRPGRRWMIEYLHSMMVAAQVFPLRRFAQRKTPREYDEAVEKVTRMVEGLDVTPPVSAYSSYYDEKKEAQSLGDLSSFLTKQRTVHDLLLQKRPATLLDIGANTGWYARLAAKQGVNVIAIEQDESCIDILYRVARSDGARILPLKLSFADLEKQIFCSSKAAGDAVACDAAATPLYRAATERLGSDMVLVLGLLHHLVLGEGRTLDEVMAILAKLARKSLVIEFVDWSDDKIVSESAFFGHLGGANEQSYSIQQLIETGRKHFASCEIRESNPATRKIVVFEK